MTWIGYRQLKSEQQKFSNVNYFETSENEVIQTINILISPNSFLKINYNKLAYMVYKIYRVGMYSAPILPQVLYSHHQTTIPSLKPTLSPYWNVINSISFLVLLCIIIFVLASLLKLEDAITIQNSVLSYIYGSKLKLANFNF